jgi:hypothetical protein
MEMQHARYFLALCEEQNFTRAAERCRIKQPTLTRAIKELEAEFGGPLFVRGWKATRLSGLGMAVRPYITNIDRSAADARRVAAAFLATPSVLALKPKERPIRKIVYGASIAATVILIAGAAVLLSRPGNPSPPLQIAAITDVYALEATIDVKLLPRDDVPTEAESD